MKLKNLGSNMNELIIGNKQILISYETPVAMVVQEGNQLKGYKTSKKWSVTTSKHINKFFAPYAVSGALQGKSIEECEQSELDNLLNEVK